MLMSALCIGPSVGKSSRTRASAQRQWSWNAKRICPIRLPQHCPPRSELARHDAWRTAISEQIWHTQACVRAMRHKSMKCTHREAAMTRRTFKRVQCRHRSPYAMRASHLRTKATPRIADSDSRESTRASQQLVLVSLPAVAATCSSVH